MIAASVPLGAAGDALGLALAALATAAGLCGLAVAGAHARGLPPRAALALATGHAEPGPLRLAAAVAAMLVLSEGVDLALEWSGLRAGSNLEAFEQQVQGSRGAILLALLVGVALAPAVAEELLFRGLLQGALRPRLGGAGAVAGSALLFGAAHLDPAHALGAAVLGLYLGALRELTGSIRAGLVCHAVNNTVAVATAVAGASAFR